MILILFVVFVVATFVGAPICFSIGLSSMGFLLSSGYPPLSIIAQKMVDGLNSTTLMALPLFVLSGNIMSYGCTPRLMRLANLLLGRMPGGLGSAACGGCAFFGAVSGSGVATTAAIGGIMGPEMVEKGYGKGYTASLLACAGSMGAIIPPSICLVVYSSCCGASIGRLFAGGVIPGLLTVLVLLLYNTWISKRRGYGGVPQVYTAREKLRIVIDAVPALLMPIFVLGSILTGIATPTEAATIAVFYSVFLSCVVYRELNVGKLVDVLVKSALSSAAILIIIAAAAPFGWIMATENIPTIVANGILSISHSKFVIILLISLLMLFLGTFMETNSIIILLVPMLYPVVTSLGMDPVHFGVVMALNLAVGGCTPPLAVALFTSTRILGIQVEDTFPDILITCGMMCVSLALVTAIPALTLFIPNLIFG